MANYEPQRGMVAIELDKSRVIFFDLAATWLLVQKYGIDFIRALYTFENERLTLTSPDALVFFLLAGLQHELGLTRETLTLEQVKAMIHPWNFAKVFQAVAFALSGATATPAEPETPPGKTGAAAAKPKPAAAPDALRRRGSTSTRRSVSSAVR